MRHTVISVLLLGVSLLTLSEPLSAHHGSAVYDMENMTTVKGTVTEFQFSNPHAQILFDVKNEKGNVENWVGETNSATALYRLGWKKDTLKPGDQVTVVGWRSKNGTATMHLHKLTLAGKELSMER
jgi:DNA/RNA endonuclease YhcR with UshA esterase domain